MAALRERLIALIEPLLGQLGYELVELEFAPGRGRGSLRIFIDRPEGIGIGDCERVSREVSALMDVEDPVPTAYSLFKGSRVLVELSAPRDGRRRYTGMLQEVSATGVTLEVDRQRVELPFGEIAKARLAPLEGAARGM
jgi:ribosome maturation factor RimP